MARTNNDDDEEERAPVGRPEIGPQIMTRIRPAMLTQIDKEAERRGLSRAETMRQLLEDGLTWAFWDNEAVKAGRPSTRSHTTA